MFREILGLNRLLFLLFTILASLIYTYYINTFYSTPEVFVNTYMGQLSTERIYEMFDQSRKYILVGYSFVIVGVLLRILYSTMAISLGNYLSDDRFLLGSILNVCIKGEAVFVLMLLAKMVNFELFKEVSTIYDLSEAPLSLPQLVDVTSLPKWLIQPLAYLNFFEFLYVLFLSGLLTGINSKSFVANLKVVSLSYGIGLLLWSLVLVYLAVIFS